MIDKDSLFFKLKAEYCEKLGKVSEYPILIILIALLSLAGKLWQVRAK